MTKSVTFFYDYVSPASYLAWTQLPAICAKAGATLVKKPMLLGGLHKAVGNVAPIAVPAKAAWMFADLKRHAAHYGVPLKMPAKFPFNTIPALRGALWAAKSGVLDAYDKALFEAAWARGEDISDAAAVKALVAAAGLDAESFAAAIQMDDIKKGLMDATNEAVAAGAFGAPTFVVADELHFGQDRLPWIERALAKAV
jgi:2-hydroxychromene-2-carboxylate isomerase